MSHFTTIETQIRDVSALRAACSELGLTIESNAQARGYSLNRIKGDLVIRLKGPYDIAVNRHEDGTFRLTRDWWDDAQGSLHPRDRRRVGSREARPQPQPQLPATVARPFTRWTRAAAGRRRMPRNANAATPSTTPTIRTCRTLMALRIRLPPFTSTARSPRRISGCGWRRHPVGDPRDSQR